MTNIKEESSSNPSFTYRVLASAYCSLQVILAFGALLHLKKTNRSKAMKIH